MEKKTSSVWFLELHIFLDTICWHHGDECHLTKILIVNVFTVHDIQTLGFLTWQLICYYYLLNYASKLAKYVRERLGPLWCGKCARWILKCLSANHIFTRGGQGLNSISIVFGLFRRKCVSNFWNLGLQNVGRICCLSSHLRK